MAAIETTEEVMDKIKLNVAQLGISTIRKLQIALTSYDPKKEGKVDNTEFSTAMKKVKLFLSKIDESNIVKAYRTSPTGLVVDYATFLNDISPPLVEQRENAVVQLFTLIQSKQKTPGKVILYTDLMALCNVKNHPEVQSGQFSTNYVQEAIVTAFDSVQNENDEITLDSFKSAFRGIGSGYPYNHNAFTRFIQSCWSAVFENVKMDSVSKKEEDKYVGQIESMLAEKTRQKCKGSMNEDRALLKQFKHFSSYPESETCSYVEFKQTLESYGCLAPEKELTICYDAHCSTDEKTGNKKLFYRTFIQQLFEKH